MQREVHLAMMRVYPVSNAILEDAHYLKNIASKCHIHLEAFPTNTLHVPLVRLEQVVQQQDNADQPIRWKS